MSIEHVNEVLNVLRPYRDFFLTAHGALIGAVEFEGIDPDGLNTEELDRLAVHGAAISRPINRAVDQVQTYLHFEGATLDFKDRQHDISDMLNTERRKALLSRGLAGSRIVHYFECRPTRGAQHNWIDFVYSLVMSPFSSVARDQLQATMRSKNVLALMSSELERQHSILAETIDTYCAKWSSYTRVKPLSQAWTLAHLKFMATFDPRHLQWKGAVEDHIASRVHAGGYKHGQFSNLPVWVVAGPEERYVRLGALGAPPRPPKAGLFAKPPRGNYLIVSRFTPKTDVEREHEFRQRSISVYQRETLSRPIDLIKGKDVTKDEMKAGNREELENLELAEALPTVWGEYHCHIAVFGTKVDEIRNTSILLDTMISPRGYPVIWEKTGRWRAFSALQVGGKHLTIRNQLVTLDKAQDSALIFRSHPGQPRIEYLNEESVYVFETETGEPFHWSPWIDDRAFTLAVGRTGSGKTFTKNTLASHISKFFGMLELVDIDPGSESLARLFGDEAGVFNAASGLNLFATCSGPGDMRFKSHFTSVLMMMLSCNEDPRMQALEKGEQAYLDEALEYTLHLEPANWRLGTFVSHLPKELADKFKRWVYSRTADSIHGRYARLVDVPQDACIGDGRRLSVYNLLDVKNDPKALGVLTHEIFQRIRRKFERLETRDVPGFAVIDEARFWLSRPNTAKELTESMQTWRKYGKGIELWTQSPDHYLECPGFASLRNAATAFWFLPDVKFDAEKYREAFHLTDGELEAIRTLRKAGTGPNAWSEIYLVQREINVSKKVRLRVEPVQEVVSLSDARRAQYRDELLPKLVQQYGMAEGYKRCLALINERVFPPEEDEAA